MKALYSNEKKPNKPNYSQLVSYNYNTRYQALKDGFKFVHLFESNLDQNGLVNYKHYSTMFL